MVFSILVKLFTHLKAKGVPKAKKAGLPLNDLVKANGYHLHYFSHSFEKNTPGLPSVLTITPSIGKGTSQTHTRPGIGIPRS